MADAPTTVTVADLQAGGWSFASHLNCGAQGHHYTYSSKAFPEALICKGWNKKKGGGRDGYAVMQIRRPGAEPLEVPLRDLEEVAMAISKVREGIARDAEWEATDPARKAAS